MTSAKSQFLTINDETQTVGVTTKTITDGQNLLNSLAVSFADTRRGFDTSTANAVEEMKAYASVNRSSSRVYDYLDKITPTAKAPATPRATGKMGGGMM